MNPTTAIIEAGRGLIIGEPFHVVLAVAVAATFALGLGMFALRGLRRAEPSA